MSLVQDFYENASVRLAGVAIAAFTAVTSLSGCNATMPQRVVTQTMTSGTLPARQALKREIGAPFKLTQCPPPAKAAVPAETESGVGGWADRVFGAVKDAVLPTRRVTIGDPNCDLK